MANPIKLKTQRLLLRPFELGDARDVYEYAQDPDWSQFLPLPVPYTYRDAEEFVARSFLTSWETDPIFAITLNGKVIGSFDVRVDLKNNAAEVGYALGKAQWGQGFTAEAGSAAMDWAFREFDLARIVARADIENHQSWKVMKKLGMQREGIARSNGPSPRDPGSREDTVAYSILRHEWEQLTTVTSYQCVPVTDSRDR